MKRRRRIPPRTDIPDWRDPDMPVIVVTGDQWGNRHVRYWTPEQRQEFSQMAMRDGAGINWRNDPTYYSRKSPCPTALASSDTSPSTLLRKLSPPAASGAPASQNLQSANRAVTPNIADIAVTFRAELAKVFSR